MPYRAREACETRGPYLLAIECSQDALPVGDVHPLPELEANLLEVRDFAHAELFVQCDTRIIRQRNAADRCVNALPLQSPKQLFIQAAAKPLLAESLGQIDGGLD